MKKSWFGRRVTKDGLLLLVGDGGARALIFLASIYLANLLGPDRFGSVTIGLTILSYAMWFGDLGLAPLGTRELARDRDEREFELRDILWLKSFLGLVGMLIAGAVVYFVIDQPQTRNLSYLFLLALLPSMWQFEWYFQGKRRYSPIAVTRYLFGGGYVLGILLLVRTVENISLIPVIYALALLAGAVGAVWLRDSEDTILPVPSIFSRNVWRKWWRALQRSTPIGFGSMMVQGIQLLPPVVIAMLYKEGEVGIFGAAYRLAIAFLVLDRAFIALYLPRASHAYSAGTEAFGAMLRRTFRVVLAVAVALLVALVLGSGLLIDLFYDEEFSRAAPVLAILSTFIASTLLNSFFSYALIASSDERAYFRSSLISSIIAFILILVLTWKLGLNGAAIGIASGEIVMALLMAIEFRRSLSFSLLKRDDESGEGR